MKNYRYFIFLIVINSALSLKKDTRLGKKIPAPKHANCDKIKCPAVEQPICAKLVYRNAGNKTVFVVMVNKCEMNYVKCHEGLEAVVVPMQSCGHDNFLKSGKKRSKRATENEQLQEAQEEDTTEPEFGGETDVGTAADETLEETEDSVIKTHNIVPIKGPPPNYDGEDGEPEIGEISVQEAQEEDTTEPEFGEEADVGTAADETLEETEDSVIKTHNVVPIKGPPPNYDGEDEEPEIGEIRENSGPEFTPENMPEPDLGDWNAERYEDIDESKTPEFYLEVAGNIYNDDDEGMVAGPIKQDEYGKSSEDDVSISVSHDKGEYIADDKQHFQPNVGADLTVDWKQYYADCPTVCPSRDIMVCAKCQHGVFRTFLTTCHMRMFGCLHTDETLELVSRMPCVLSAPYMSESSMQPAGRVREPSDEDRVLRFLLCRELSQQSREADPRCVFQDDEDTKMTEPQKLNDNY